MTVDTTAISALQRAVSRYAETWTSRHPGGTLADVLRHAANNFAWELYRETKELAPEKGIITATMLAGLRSGKGIKIRSSIKLAIRGMFASGKKTRGYGPRRGANAGRQMVKMELASRERARGFLAHSVPKTSRGSQSMAWASSSTVSGDVLGTAGLAFQSNEGIAVVNLGSSTNQGANAFKGFSKPVAASAIEASIEATAQDLEQYVSEKATSELLAQFAREGLA